ncbi:MAG: CcoQ/FixQ family Cbb3-type cytochrome c oxidase assembly chaperone [Pseudomonadota bacterium]|nr:CcoQ/FixQ family Cbb3-type cytochrome c oxidase assembly chaperone [Pseudomonadota bacterium]
MSNGWISGVATALLLICFLGIVVWAWSSRRKNEFEQAARLPLDADDVAKDREVPL